MSVAVLEGRERIVNRSVNPLLESLPDKFACIEPHQINAVNQILRAFETVNVVVLDAPTGSGKSLIGEVVRRMMKLRAPYICTTKSLQQQLLAEFPYAKLLMGRANYPTQMYRDHFHPQRWEGHISCDDCTWSLDNACRWCTNKSVCPYEQAKQEALRAQLAIINSSYFLAEANSAGKFSKQQLVIVDEADTLEEVLMSYVSVHVSERRMTQWGWQPPEKVTVKESYAEWLEARIEDLARVMRQLPNEDDPRVLREKRFVGDLRTRMRGVLSGLDSDAWTYTGRKQSDKPGDGASFKPARVDFLGKELLWSHGDKWLLMSATPISSKMMVEDVGCDQEYAVVKVPNMIPVANRRVKIRATCNMAQKHKEAAWPKMVKGIREVIADHPGERVLIHSVSYALTRAIVEGLQGTGRIVVTYSHSLDRQSALRQFRDTEGAVLVAPSFERGVDLVGDDCRVQIIAKVPYPYIGDRQISTRMHSRGGRDWYNMQTIRLIAQMAGRAVRGRGDWAVTYIMDDQFKTRLWNEARSLFPSWFVEGIQWR